MLSTQQQALHGMQRNMHLTTSIGHVDKRQMASNNACTHCNCTLTAKDGRTRMAVAQPAGFLHIAAIDMQAPPPSACRHKGSHTEHHMHDSQHSTAKAEEEGAGVVVQGCGTCKGSKGASVGSLSQHPLIGLRPSNKAAARHNHAAPRCRAALLLPAAACHSAVTPPDSCLSCNHHALPS